MDPITALGAAGSVVGIADVAFQLGKSVSKACSEIASTQVVLRTIIDEVESMGTALSQISDLVRAEEQNVKHGLGFKLFTETALKVLGGFWRIEGTILEKAGNSDFEKEIETRRAEFRKQVGGKGKGASPEFRLKEGLADAAASLFSRTKWQFKGTLAKLKEYCDQLRGFQLVFTVMLATISLQTSRRHQDWNAIVVALTQINAIDQQRPIPDVLADLSASDDKESISSSQKNGSERTRASEVNQASRKPHLLLARSDQPSKDMEAHQTGGVSRKVSLQPRSETSENLLAKTNHSAGTILEHADDHNRVLRTLVNVPEPLASKADEIDTEFRPALTSAPSPRIKVEGTKQDVFPTSSSGSGQSGEALSRSLEDQFERNKPRQGLDYFESLPYAEDNNASEPLDGGRHLANKHVVTVRLKEPETSTPAEDRDLSPTVGALGGDGGPKERSRSTTETISDISTNPETFLDFGLSREPPRLFEEPEQNDSSANVTSEFMGSHNPRGTQDGSRLVFIVKEGVTQPAPQLSTRHLGRSFMGKFNLRSSRELDYREFAFLKDLDRKAIESILKDVKPSKQASVQIRKLNKSFLPTFGKAASAVLVIIEEPGKSLKSERYIATGTTESGAKTKDRSSSPRDGQMSDDDYFRELTTYKVVSIHPLMDVRQPKLSIGKVEWDNCAKTEVTLDRADILQRLARIDNDGLSVANKQRSLDSQQRQQIQTIFVETARGNMELRNFEWSIRQLELIKERIRLWSVTPITLTIVVYLQRTPRPHVRLESLFAVQHALQPSMSMRGLIQPIGHRPHSLGRASMAPGYPAMSAPIARPQSASSVRGDAQMTISKPNYTRMARRHLSLECLRAKGIDFTLDSDRHKLPTSGNVFFQTQIMIIRAERGELLEPLVDRERMRKKVPGTLKSRHREHLRWDLHDSLAVLDMPKRVRQGLEWADTSSRDSRSTVGEYGEVDDDDKGGLPKQKPESTPCITAAGLGNTSNHFKSAYSRVPESEISRRQGQPRATRDGYAYSSSRYLQPEDIQKPSVSRVDYNRSASSARDLGPFSLVSPQHSRASGMFKSTLPEVDKDVVNLLLRRWTPGAAELSTESDGRVSKDGDGTAAEERHKEHQEEDQEADRDISLE